MFNIFSSLAELEKDLIHERTMAGLKAARARGKCGGGKVSLKFVFFAFIACLSKSCVNDPFTTSDGGAGKSEIIAQLQHHVVVRFGVFLNPRLKSGATKHNRFAIKS